jgi:hypothetical protein
MITKNTRFVTRNTTDAGKVPTSEDLLTGELGINMADKKMWFKDASGNVQRIAGGGRGVGDFLQYENFGDVPTIFTDDYMMFRQSNPGPEDFTNVAIYRDTGTAFGSGTLGNTNSNLIVRTDVRADTNAFQWNALFQLQVHPGLTRTSTTGQNEPLALGVTLRKQSDIVAWALYSSIEDFTVDPVYATIGWEFGFKANLADPNKRRVVVDMQLNSIDDTPGYTKYGDNEIATVFNITPSLNESDRVVVEKVFRITGRIGVGLDMSGMKKAVHYGTTNAYYADHDLECIALPNGGNIVYRNGENGPIVGGLSYNSAIGNGGFALSGQTIGTGHGTPSGEALLIKINGVDKWIMLAN